MHTGSLPKLDSTPAPVGERNFRQQGCLNTRLRHRCCLLYLTSAILRSKSLYKADLSDFFGLSPPKKEVDVHQPWILINQIAEGKTTHGKLQYGRAIRHKDVCRCAVGGIRIAIYLMSRFKITNEFATMTLLDDWKDNLKWFNVKLLVDVHGNLWLI
jgi:Centromere DNA-binding protein complex CBF3 subunit, domain 2